jgi:hypothetical protein
VRFLSHRRKKAPVEFFDKLKGAHNDGVRPLVSQDGGGKFPKMGKLCYLAGDNLVVEKTK